MLKPYILLSILYLVNLLNAASCSTDTVVRDSQAPTILEWHGSEGSSKKRALFYIYGYGTQKKQEKKLHIIMKHFNGDIKNSYFGIIEGLGNSPKTPRFKFTLMTPEKVVHARWGARPGPKACVISIPYDINCIAVILGGSQPESNPYKKGRIVVDYQKWLQQVAVQKEESSSKRKHSKHTASTIPEIPHIEQDVELSSYYETDGNKPLTHEVAKAILSARVQERETLNPLLEILAGRSLAAQTIVETLGESLDHTPKIIALKLQVTYPKGTVAFEAYRKSGYIRIDQPIDGTRKIRHYRRSGLSTFSSKLDGAGV